MRNNTRLVYGDINEMRDSIALAKTATDPVKALELKYLVLDRRRRNTFVLADYDKLTDRMNTILAVREEVLKDQRRKDPAWAVRAK